LSCLEYILGDNSIGMLSGPYDIYFILRFKTTTLKSACQQDSHATSAVLT
jgi:hypothetical protein